MPKKPLENQEPRRRAPQQTRSLHKVELILEAATRMLERGDIDSLTTNAVAKTAGISIGTLYQYFKDKEAVLAALVEREMTDLSARILKSLQGPPPELQGERIRTVVHAVLEAYGGRRQAHRQLMAHGLNRGSVNRLTPMYTKLIRLFTGEGITRPGQAELFLSKADAFVLTHAVAGVLRTLVAMDDQSLPREDIEVALTKLIVGFLPPSQKVMP